jgi:hypothetical protein
MDEQLRKMIFDARPDNIFSYHEQLRRIVRLFMGEDVKPGFQNTRKFREFEVKLKFASGEAVSALAREAHRNLTKKQRVREKRIVKHVVEHIAKHATVEELTRKCFVTSVLLCLILEQFGVWAVMYLGTLLYFSESQNLRKSFYYVNDLYAPPEDSAARGHSWVYTPAFPLVDLTARHQPLPQSMADNVPFPVLIESDDEQLKPQNFWYVDPSDPPEIRRAKIEILQREVVSDYNEVHHAILCKGPVDLLYVPMSTQFAPERLHEFESKLRLGGKTVQDVYKAIKDTWKEK